MRKLPILTRYLSEGLANLSLAYASGWDSANLSLASGSSWADFHSLKETVVEITSEHSLSIGFKVKLSNVKVQ